MDSVASTKVISALCYPAGLATLLLSLSALAFWIGRRRAGRRIGLLAALLLLIFSNPRVAAHLALSLEQQYPQQAFEDIAAHDAIVVLGGGLRLPAPPARHAQLGSTADRYWHATRLYRTGKASRIVVSGGNAFEQPGLAGEAQYAAELLQRWGVPASDIQIEADSRTTRQNASLTIAGLLQENVQSILLVTSAMHMPRALTQFEGHGLKVTAASADVLIRQTNQPVALSWIPAAHALDLSTRALHEYYGILWYRLTDFVNQSG
ncbi:MAG: YdcF family protein [Gammaproteobacteria bacterium]|nr:YdcF family protein [Gammaproteobacteria bacterium]